MPAPATLLPPRVHRARPWCGVALASAALLTMPAALAQSCMGHSPAHTVALLELYTSEGCSSCPPADSFVSGLRAAGFGSAQVVPLGLHVDYWDAIGWKDRYGSADSTARQRALAQRAHTTLVYTPEIFIGGIEVRRWAQDAGGVIGRINRTPARAAIALALAPGRAGDGVVATASGSAPAGSVLHWALVEDGLVSQVRSGENAGRSLRHDFVVRRWLASGAATADSSFKSSAALAAAEIAGPGRKLALSAYVAAPDGQILQAYSLPLCAAP